MMRQLIFVAATTLCPAFAAQIFITDSPEGTLTVVASGNTGLAVDCGTSTEMCPFTLQHFQSAFANPSPVAVNIFEPGGQILSDTLQLTFVEGSKTFWTFNSDVEGMTLSPIIGGQTIVEDGTAQTVVTIFYGDFNGAPNGTDTILIQSDLVEGVGVPEPSGLMMALSGLAFVGVPAIRRRIMSRR